MDYIREAIEVLRAYNDYQKSIINLQEEILIIDTELQGSAISYKENPGGSGIVNKDDIVLNKIYRKSEALKELKATSMKVQRIDRILQDISQDDECKNYGIVLRRWFIESADKECIANDLGYSIRQLYNIKNKAIKKFAIHLHGIKVPI